MDNSTTSYGGFSEALSNGGSGAAENGGGINHGWQKVTNPKKHKRQEARSNKSAQPDAAGSLHSAGGPESKVFQALEREAEERRARREALLVAAMEVSTLANVQSDSDADEENHQQGEANGTASNGESTKIKPEKPKKMKVTVAEAASAIDPSDLASFLAQITESFAELPDVQLMRFADYFGRAFNSVTPTQFGWNKILKESSISKSAEIPFCNVSDSVNKTVCDWLAARPLDALENFVIWGLNDVVNDMHPQQGNHKGSKGVSIQVSTKTKVGVLAVLSLTLRRRPEALLQKAPVIRTSPQFQGQENLAMLAWAYGQAAQGDLVVGMQLWVQNLLPLACGKNSTPASRDIALQFVESILFVNLKKARPVLQNGASRKGERLVPPVALDFMMRASFPSDIARTKATERFQGIYPLVKELALYGPHRSKATKSIAQQLLPLCLEAASEDVPALANEACALFIWCLSENADCFKQWEKLHLDKLKGSVKVLSFMCGEWRAIAGQLNPLDDLKNTINILRVKNREALENVKGDAKLDTMLKVAEKHCKLLKKNLARTGPCLKAVATLIAGVGIAYGFYLLNLDVHLVR